MFTEEKKIDNEEHIKSSAEIVIRALSELSSPIEQIKVIHIAKKYLIDKHDKEIENLNAALSKHNEAKTILKNEI